MKSVYKRLAMPVLLLTAALVFAACSSAAPEPVSEAPAAQVQQQAAAPARNERAAHIRARSCARAGRHAHAGAVQAGDGRHDARRFRAYRHAAYGRREDGAGDYGHRKLD